jgi:hypothetical protein
MLYRIMDRSDGQVLRNRLREKYEIGKIVLVYFIILRFRKILPLLSFNKRHIGPVHGVLCSGEIDCE